MTSTDAPDPGRAAEHARLLADLPSATPGPLATRPWWVLRVVVPALLTALVVADVAVSEVVGTPCTPASPCVWAASTDVVDGVHLAGLLLTWLQPLVGLPVLAVGAVGSLLAYREAGDPLVWSAPVAAQALGAALVWAALVLRPTGRPDGPARRLPVHGREVLVTRGLGPRGALVVVALVVAAAAGGWWWHSRGGLAEHLARAEPVVVEVVAVDDEDLTVDVEVPGVTGVVVLEPLEDHAVGDRLPALVDRGGEETWVSLDEEPVRADDALVLAAGAAAAGLVAGLVPALRTRRRRRQLLLDGGPAWRTSSVPSEDGDAVLLPALGLRLPLAEPSGPDGTLEEVLEAVGLLHHEVYRDTTMREPVPDDDGPHRDADGGEDGRQPHDEGDDGDRDDGDGDDGDGDDGDEDEDEDDPAWTALQQDFAAAWRGEVGSTAPDDLAQPTVLLGGDRPGGLAVAVTEDHVLVPSGPLAPLTLGDHRWLRLLADAPRHLDGHGLPGRPGGPLPHPVRGVDEDEEPLVVDLGTSAARRLLAVSVVLVPLGLWLAVVVQPWQGWQDAVWPITLGVPGVGGLAASRRRVRCDRDGVVARDGGLERRLGWDDVVGTRVVEDDVLLGVGVDLDEDVDAVGGRAPTGLGAERAARLVERWRRDAGASSRPDAGVHLDRPVAAAAALAAVVALAVPVVHLLG
ncbi:hypothetical protein [Pseudokineococcus lusitanus]|uniref:Uncharacterized protein n=1 Tax=Pseudokineococcus lusitanus TaxID=763993 RepID=A0A3N1HNR6_9ACTN|nr:hypothetical protein [Pseudokineococcus lusitanus]ROP43992.1 hypothetical protein EDC03_1589 [Pseudokineococcus lusitanus]